MDRILLGDNQFFGVNHLSEEKARAQSLRFQKDRAILDVLDTALDLGITTFMCTTHDRMAGICQAIRSHPGRYRELKIYPCMPYAHKYANAVTELGMMGALKAHLPGSMFRTMTRGGWAYLNRDFITMMQLLVDAEMKMFQGLNTPVVFLQNVVTDLLLGLGMQDVLAAFHEYIRTRHKAQAGYITMNLPRLLDVLEGAGIENPIICSSINRIGFRMSGGREIYEQTIASGRCRVVAMQVLAAGALRPGHAFEYVCSQPGIESILFGASSREHIRQSRDMIMEMSGVTRPESWRPDLAVQEQTRAAACN